MANILPSFVDRDMIMRYIGGGIGHTNRRPTQTSSEDVTMEDVIEREDNNGPDVVTIEDCQMSRYRWIG